MSNNEAVNDASNKEKSRKPEEECSVPLLLKPWVFFQQNLPVITLRGLNISVLLASLSYFFCVRKAGVALFEANGWQVDSSEITTPLSCFVSLCHSSFIILPLCQCLFLQPFEPTRALESAPKHWQLSADALLQFCTGYMMQDSFFIFYNAFKHGFQPGDELFLGHHFATITYMTQCRWIAAGHISTMTCILVGEISNPFMMVWYITKAATESTCCNGSKVAAILYVSKFIYAVVYFFARSILMPAITLYKFHDFFLSGQKNVPFMLCAYWYSAIVIVIGGSYGYIVESWEIIQEYL